MQKGLAGCRFVRGANVQFNQAFLGIGIWHFVAHKQHRSVTAELQTGNVTEDMVLIAQHKCSGRRYCGMRQVFETFVFVFFEKDKRGGWRWQQMDVRR